MSDRSNPSLEPKRLYSETGVLLLHGLTGTPSEMKPIAKHLKRMGFHVEVPLLPGHGVGHRELLATTWQDWLEGARTTLKAMMADYDQVFIAGLSMGSLLAILLAKEFPELNGLILYSMDLAIPGPDIPPTRHILPFAFKLPFMRRYFYWTEKPPYGLQDKRLQKMITRSIEAAKRGESEQYGLFRTYVGSLYQMELLIAEVEKQAPFVRCPLSIIHSLEDTMLSATNATRIYGLLGSETKSVTLINGCDHVMTVDLRKNDVACFYRKLYQQDIGGAVSDSQSVRSRLSAEIFPYLTPVSSAEWDKFFPTLPDSYELIESTLASGFPGFQFHSILVRYDDEPILLLPLFQTAFDIGHMTDAWVKKIIDRMPGFLFPLFTPKIMGVGFVEGEWGEVGVAPDVDRKILEEAWDIALESMDSLAEGLEISFVAFLNLNTDSGRMLPMHKLKAYSQLEGFPCGVLPLPYTSLDQYFAQLSAATRKNLRRKLRAAKEIEIVRTRDPKPWLDKIYAFYRLTVDRQELQFGVHQPEFFENVCKTVPGAEYTLYFSKGQFVAFNLLVLKNDRLVDKYFGMDEQIGRQYALYFVSWVENVRYCIEQKIPVYHAGPASEELKQRLGATLLPSAILFKQRHPLINAVLKKVYTLISAQQEFDLPPVTLGSYWLEPGTDTHLKAETGPLKVNAPV